MTVTKVDFLSHEHKENMQSFMVDVIKGFRTCNVAEGLVEFTERKRVLVAGTSARPGPYRFSVTPYLREPAECLSDFSKIFELVVMKGTQTGGTDGLMMNHELYCIYYGIGGVQYITSDDDLAQEHMEKRLGPMIDAAGMQDMIVPPVKKKSNKATGDTKRSKSFGGTYLRVTGANSESKLSSLPSRILHIDEIDKYKTVLSGGGNPVEKAVRRTDSYGNLKKIVYISTPKEKATSQIEPLFEQGDMRYYYIPCPSCGEMQQLKWNQIKWDKDEDGEILLEYDEDINLTNDPVYHECINSDCKYKMRNHEKVIFMMEKGHGGKAEWRATKKPDRPGIRSYHISALYGFRTWIDIVIQFTKIGDDPILRQDFINDTLGETYTHKVDKPNHHYLISRAEPDWVRGTIPNDVKFLNLGCDVQKDRLECQIMGWSNRMESWVIDYHVLAGNPSESNDKCWNKLEEIIMAEYERMDGKILRLQTAFIDAPYENSSVMAFCERFNTYYNPTSWVGVFPVFGKQTGSYIVKEHVSTISTPEILMNDQKLKKEIYSNLKKKAPASGLDIPYGYIHFPDDLEETYYKQLTAEEVIVTVDKKGIETTSIHNSKQRRNEPLDVTKMCYAGIYYAYIKFFETWNKALKRQHKREVQKDWGLFWHMYDNANGESNVG